MKIKKFLISLIVCAASLVLAFAASACDIGSFSDATQPPGSGAGEGNNGGTSSPDDPFTISVVDENGNSYHRYLMDDGVLGQWRDLSTGAVYTAEFSSDTGCATCPVELDGEYRVSLANFADPDYSYNPNDEDYVATNSSRAVTIQLVELNAYRRTGTQDGTAPYERAFRISSIGVYRVEIRSAGSQVYFRYEPEGGGSYGIESWVNATENNVNPAAYDYGANVAFAENPTYISGGGEANNSYTRNFRFTFNLDQSSVGSTLNFSITATSRSGTYPVTVDFALTRDGEYSYELTDQAMMLPMEDFEPADVEEGTLTYVYSEDGGGRVLDERLLTYVPEEDRFYYTDQNGESHMLYGYISSVALAFSTITGEEPTQPLTSVDYMSPALRSYNSSVGYNVDYRLLVRGYSGAQTHGGSGPQDIYTTGGPMYVAQITGYDSASGMPEVELVEYEGSASFRTFGGYAQYANAGGMYPVTAELMYFFEIYCREHAIFFDGHGMVDGPSAVAGDGYTYDAYDDSMWLVYCAYYA